MRHFKSILIILAVAVVPFGLTVLLHPNLPSFNPEELDEGEVSMETVKNWGRETFLWVDARSRSDYDSAHIESAILLNEEKWESCLPELLDTWQPDMKLVVYCSSLSCSASHEVAERIRDELNIHEVFVLKGGWEVWTQSEGIE